MRLSALALLLASSLSSMLVVAACSSDGGGAGGAGDGGTGADTASAAEGGGPVDADGGGALDARVDDGASDGADGSTVEPTTPVVQFIGRFDESDPSGFRMAWPGSTVVARFDGTDVSVKLSQTDDGYSAGPSWFNVIVDDQVKTPFSVAGLAETHVLASGLAPGPHKVEIEKRTEANHGVVRFEGFTFTGGKGLLAPPPRRAHRLEFVSESTIDGFGVEGNNTTTCINTAPPQFDNVRKSLAMYTGAGVNAEVHVTAYSGKGVSKNGSAADTLTMPVLFDRALPDPGSGTPWTHSKWVPEAIVISLGGVDYGDGLSAAPADFQTKYAAFVAHLRAVYGNAPYVLLTVWSQIKNNGGDNELRTPLEAALDGVIATRAGLGDTKVSRYSFPEANPAVETGCYSHANDAHHQAMAALLVAQLKAKLPGW
jgi:hypothetical protein